MGPFTMHFYSGALLWSTQGRETPVMLKTSVMWNTIRSGLLAWVVCLTLNQTWFTGALVERSHTHTDFGLKTWPSSRYHFPNYHYSHLYSATIFRMRSESGLLAQEWGDRSSVGFDKQNVDSPYLPWITPLIEALIVGLSDRSLTTMIRHWKMNCSTVTHVADEPITHWQHPHRFNVSSAESNVGRQKAEHR